MQRLHKAQNFWVYSEFLSFWVSMADFWQKFWVFCREFSGCRDYALICRKCCDYALFCRECRDYALFGVQFYSEFWQKSCKNIDIIFDTLDVTLKLNFLIDINVEINGDIIFQTSVYDPWLYPIQTLNTVLWLKLKNLRPDLSTLQIFCSPTINVSFV